MKVKLNWKEVEKDEQGRIKTGKGFLREGLTYIFSTGGYAYFDWVNSEGVPACKSNPTHWAEMPEFNKPGEQDE